MTDRSIGAAGRGFVYVKNETILPEYPRLNESMPEQRAVVSVFHQLHCLVSSRESKIDKLR